LISVSIFFVAGVVLLLSFILALGSIGVVIQSEDPKVLADSPTFVLSLTWIYFFSISEAIIILVGALVNQATDAQRFVILCNI
jgi:hypothetical protein